MSLMVQPPDSVLCVLIPHARNFLILLLREFIAYFSVLKENETSVIHNRRHLDFVIEPAASCTFLSSSRFSSRPKCVPAAVKSRFTEAASGLIETAPLRCIQKYLHAGYGIRQ